MFYSPLRYPGGKNKLSAFIAKICLDNDIHGHYIEPYAGGSCVALFLLFQNIVERITINDKDRSIYAFWYSVLYETDALCDLITMTEITIENWLTQKEIQTNKETAKLLDLGFSTLFLNRTNRDGIIKGGVIGGKEQQGDYKLDCRFNKKEIIQKIKNIAKFSNQISLHSLDALQLLSEVEKNTDSIIYFDPPYYLKGSSLYMNYYQKSDHKAVADAIKLVAGINWIVSYDNHEVIKELYKPFQPFEYNFNHSAHSSKLGQEVLFFSKQLITPKPIYNPTGFKINNKSNSKKIKYIHPKFAPPIIH